MVWIDWLIVEQVSANSSCLLGFTSANLSHEIWTKFILVCSPNGFWNIFIAIM